MSSRSYGLNRAHCRWFLNLTQFGQTVWHATVSVVPAGTGRARQLSDVLAESAGLSANATAGALNERKLPMPRGGPWTARSIINMRKRLES